MLIHLQMPTDVTTINYINEPLVSMHNFLKLQFQLLDNYNTQTQSFTP